jgi:hypothetical protein
MTARKAKAASAPVSKAASRRDSQRGGNRVFLKSLK